MSWCLMRGYRLCETLNFMNMKHIIGLMLLFAIVACSNEIENLELNTQIAEEMIIIGDTVSTASVNGSGWENLPDNWFDYYQEPQSGEIRGSYTIQSPVGQGTVTINYIISYEYSEKLFVQRDRALIRVNGVTTSFVRNTPKYLMWRESGTLVSPVNFQLSVIAPQNRIYLTLRGYLIGENSFFEENSTEEANELIIHYANFNINNY